MRKLKEGHSRREFLAGTSILIIGASLKLKGIAGIPRIPAIEREPIIDIHQHIHYHERTDQQMLAHQRAMGITTSILLPSGRPVNSASTHGGVSNGLEAEAGGNAECIYLQKNTGNNFCSVQTQYQTCQMRYLKLKNIRSWEQ